MSTSTKTQTVKADARGYAYLGKLEGAPDFSKISKIEKEGDAGTPFREFKFGKGKAATAMFKKGYVAVGANAEVEVEFKKDSILIVPVVSE